MAKLRKILRVHYREKTASELFQQLATAYQQIKETPQQFVLRALDARNKVSFAGKEADCEINYDFPLIQKTFLKSFETSLRDDILATNLRPTLRHQDLSDEDLMKQVNELASNQEERKSKLGTPEPHPRSMWVNAASAGDESTKPKLRETAGARTEPREGDQLLAEIRQIKSDLNSLKTTAREVERGEGRSQWRPTRQGQRGYRSCKEQGRHDSCRHCYSCRQYGHIAARCFKNNRGGPRDAE